MAVSTLEIPTASHSDTRKIQVFAYQRFLQILQAASFPEARPLDQRRVDLYRMQGKRGFRPVSAQEREALKAKLERENFIDSLRSFAISTMPERTASGDGVEAYSVAANTLSHKSTDASASTESWLSGFQRFGINSDPLVSGETEVDGTAIAIGLIESPESEVKDAIDALEGLEEDSEDFQVYPDGVGAMSFVLEAGMIELPTTPFTPKELQNKLPDIDDPMLTNTEPD